MKIGFIGSGKMMEALLGSFLNAKLVEKGNVWVSDKSSERTEIMKSNFGVNIAENNSEVVKNSEIVFLCVKPQDMDSVLDEIPSSANESQIFVSIAAGVKLEKLKSKLNSKIVRVMPNTPCLVGEAMSVITFAENVNDENKKVIFDLLNSAGKTLEVKEELMDAVTAVSGSGPAFFAYLIDSLAKAGEKEGLSREQALLLAEQTALGTAKLLLEKNISPEELSEMVSSPGGTTIAGREVLEKSDVAEVIQKTVAAAAARSRELGK